MIEWFNPKNKNTPFGENYREEFNVSGERTLQEILSIEQIIHENFSTKPNTLDLAGGFGRIGKQLQEMGMVSSLIDFDLNFRFLRMAQQSGVSNVVNGDMKKIPFRSNSFDLTLLMFTSFGYFSTKEEDMRVIQEAHRTLVPQGQFLIDLPNFHRITQNFSSTRELNLNNGEKIKYKKRIEKGVLIEERTIIDIYGKNRPLVQMKIRMYFSQDILTLCKEVGFSKVELMDGNLNNFNPHDSRRLWAKCTK